MTARQGAMNPSLGTIALEKEWKPIKTLWPAMDVLMNKQPRTNEQATSQE